MFRLATRSIPHIGMCAVALGASNLQPAGCFLGFGGGGEDEKAKLQAELARREAELAELRTKNTKSMGVPLLSNLGIDPQKIIGNSAHEALEMMGTQLNTMVETGLPTQMGFGFCSGYCTGFAVKKAGKVAAVGVGSIFMLLQGLSNAGYINVDYLKLQEDVGLALDRNNDGKIDQDDVKLMFGDFMRVAGYNMPAGSGFAGGVLMGLKSG